MHVWSSPPSLHHMPPTGLLLVSPAGAHIHILPESPLSQLGKYEKREVVRTHAFELPPKPENSSDRSRDVYLLLPTRQLSIFRTTFLIRGGLFRHLSALLFVFFDSSPSLPPSIMAA